MKKMSNHNGDKETDIAQSAMLLIDIKLSIMWTAPTSRGGVKENCFKDLIGLPMWILQK